MELELEGGEEVLNLDADADEEDTLLPAFDYALEDTVWSSMSSLRTYPSLSVAHKLDILDILLQDALSTTIVAKWAAKRIEASKNVRIEIKALEDEHAALLKADKHKLRTLRTEWLQRKKELFPKKDKKKSKSTPKKDTLTSPASGAASASISMTNSAAPNNPDTPGASSVTSASSSRSRSASSSPNKENNPSKSNSNSDQETAKAKAQQGRTRAASRQKEIQRRRQEKEEARLKQQTQHTVDKARREVDKLERAFKQQREAMTLRSDAKELELVRQRLKLRAQCRTQLEPLGEDRWRNRYFWSQHSDGRVFVLHAHGVFHGRALQSEDVEAEADQDPLSV